MATPLPPLKPSHGEKTCPRNAAKPTPQGAQAEAVAGRTTPHSTTGSAPLPASNASTTAAARFPATRATLVAPMLPLPWARTSWPVSFRVMR